MTEREAGEIACERTRIQERMAKCLVGQRFTYAGQRAEVTRVIGTWQGQTGSNFHLCGFLINAYLLRDEVCVGHVRVTVHTGDIETADVDERVVFRGVA